MRNINHNKTSEWILNLQEIKEILENNNLTKITTLIRSKLKANEWHGFLINNKIIVKENGFYRWNEKIPLSFKIVEKYRKLQHEKNKTKKLIANKKYTMPQTPLPKPPKVTKTRTPKIEFQVNNEPKNELGVIRRFLKWLW
jgi:hypothetical protein